MRKTPATIRARETWLDLAVSADRLERQMKFGFYTPPEVMRAAVEVGSILVNNGYCDLGTMARVLRIVKDGAFEEADCAVAFRVAEYRQRNRNAGKRPHE